MRMFSGMFEGIAAMLVVVIAIYLVIAFVLVYFAADAQGRRSGNRDEGLGARIVTSFLLTLTFQAALAGIALFLAALFDGGPEIMTKMGIGLIVGAGVASILPLVVQKSRVPALSAGARDFVGRKAIGINAIVTGAGSTVGLMGICVGLIVGEDLQPAVIAVTLVYTAGAVVTMLAVSKAGTPPVAG